MHNAQRKPLSLMVAFFVAGTAISTSQSIYAQQETEEVLEEVIVTGARGRPRTVADSPVPIDVFDSETIESVSFTDTNDVLQTLVPSYNVSRNPISDGATFIRPASLRGMPTDKTLVLVNSKRRHRSALVSIGGSGTQGPDVATIPTIALKNVEVLRDGAAAQYGSDAIAGVINFILKDSADGGSFSVDTGQYTESDGQQYTIQGNIGFPLGANGFINLSGEISQADSTTRAEQYCESWFCLDTQNPVYNPAAGYTTYTEDPTFMAAVAAMGDVVQPWGQPNTEAQRFFVNAELPLANGRELYAFGNYSSSEADGPFFYRYPGNGTIEDLREADGSIYSPLEKFPGGFTPRFFGNVTDYSLVGGYRGELNNGLMYDLSARTGENKVEYTLKQTVNPSLGPDSPTSFRPGDLINEEMQLQADFSLELDAGVAAPAILAFGVSYMDEAYKIVQGELDSYQAGPYAVSDPWGFCNDDGSPTANGIAVIGSGSSLNCADDDDAAFTVVGVGSNGFPGYSPEFSDNYERDSYAVYGDISADVTDALFMQAALRYEDYSDFGGELVGKVAGRLSLTDTFALRGSLGTGFRAPTPGQQGTTNVSTRLPNGLPVATGLFPPSGPVARALGATDLKPETSTNYTLGFTSEIGELSLTADMYRIDVDDRVYSVSTRDVSTNPSSGSAYDNYLALSGAGVAGAETIGGVFYFTNAFDTRTQGVDIVATLPVFWDSGASTTFTASMNYNKSEFASDPSAFLNAEDQYDFENFDPTWRGVMSARHSIGDLTLMARANLYGPYDNFNSGQVQEFDPTALIDLEAQYQINDLLRITFGGRNVFDQYPEKDAIGDYCCGRLYSSGTAVSWQGAYYYARLNASF
ncbi:TonB-dependent receptor plug domain-containing protein [Pseudohongiella sp.]|uniref:TonB-dependent receptor plug domain-containing protein n=1 Tax=marine sediment metagenome TaxID=412755 RepID=A0A0F9QX04_9ZZZZ|nr:TonB-dependent receptor [Pseudohongiella sp.]